MSSSTGGGQSRSLILTAMIFAVAMTFIDQTIVSIAAPTIQHDLGLSSSGMQWAINAYLLTLAAFFAFGGRLREPDVPGREHHPADRDDGVHPGVLLRRDLRADRAGREGHRVQPAHLVLLHRFRDMRADRR